MKKLIPIALISLIMGILIGWSLFGGGNSSNQEPNPQEYDTEDLVKKISNSAATKCIISGCNNEVCASEPMLSACEYEPGYECYNNATCEEQPSGVCDWTPTTEFIKCLEESET